MHPLFEKIFSPPATSAPVERIFSHSGLLWLAHEAKQGSNGQYIAVADSQLMFLRNSAKIVTTNQMISTRNSAVAVIANRTAYNVHYSYRPSGISVGITRTYRTYLVSNWSLHCLLSTFEGYHYQLLSRLLWNVATSNVPEEVNSKCPARNTAVQLSTLYTDPECHN